METVLQDFRQAIRSLLKSPGFTTAAVVTLALGIGANSAIFSVIEAVILRALPYRSSPRLVLVTDAENNDNGGFLYKDLDAFKTQSRSFEDLAIYFRDSGYSRATLKVGNEPEQVQGAWISANLFPMMGDRTGNRTGFHSRRRSQSGTRCSAEPSPMAAALCRFARRFGQDDYDQQFTFPDHRSYAGDISIPGY